MEKANDDHKLWIFQQINHVFEPMMVNMVREKPSNHVSLLNRVNHLNRSTTW